MWSPTKIIIRFCVLKRILVIHDWENLGFCQLEETSKHLQKTSSLSSVPQIVKNLELQSFILNCTNKTFDPLPTFENCLQPWSLVSTLHNVHFGKYVYLPTEQVETYLKRCVLINYSTYICLCLFGWKVNMINEETVSSKL